MAISFASRTSRKAKPRTAPRADLVKARRRRRREAPLGLDEVEHGAKMRSAKRAHNAAVSPRPSGHRVHDHDHDHDHDHVHVYGHFPAHPLSSQSTITIPSLIPPGNCFSQLFAHANPLPSPASLNPASGSGGPPSFAPASG